MLKELELKQISKKIGYKTILKQINLKFSSGDLVVLTGPNGAGKTTLLRVIAGLTDYSSGTIIWNGQAGGLEQNKIGYLGHHSMLYNNLTTSENLEFFSKLYGVFDQDKITRLLKLVGLNYYRFELVKNLSRGMQQRLALGRILVHDPCLILYDEPFTGLDVEGQQLLKEIILTEQAKGKIQLLITHKQTFLTDILFNEVKLKAGMIVGRDD